MRSGFVATHRPESLAWGPWRRTSSREFAVQVAGGPGPDRLGSSTLTSTVLEHGLADEVVLVVYPILLGTGKRFSAEGTPPCLLELLSSKEMPSGVTFHTYRVVGPLKTAQVIAP